MDTKKSVKNRKSPKVSNEVSALSESEKCFYKNPINEREVGDGAPAENVVEAMNSKTTKEDETDAENSIQSLYIHIKIDLVFIALLLVALGTRLYNLQDPRYIVLVLGFSVFCSSFLFKSLF